MSYQDVKDMLYQGHKKIANNTYLTLEHYQDTEWIWMRLHNRIVAEFQPDCLLLYSASWYTRTTKDRLNMAISLAGNKKIGGNFPFHKRIYQVNYQWYYGNYNKYDPKFYNGMKIDYTGKILGG